MSRNSRDPCPPSTGLGALEPAFKHMIAEAANRNLINQLLDNELEGNPTLLFYTTQMDLSLARLCLLYTSPSPRDS